MLQYTNVTNKYPICEFGKENIKQVKVLLFYPHLPNPYWLIDEKSEQPLELIVKFKHKNDDQCDIVRKAVISTYFQKMRKWTKTKAREYIQAMTHKDPEMRKIQILTNKNKDLFLIFVLSEEEYSYLLKQNAMFSDHPASQSIWNPTKKQIAFLAIGAIATVAFGVHHISNIQDEQKKKEEEKKEKKEEKKEKEEEKKEKKEEKKEKEEEKKEKEEEKKEKKEKEEEKKEEAKEEEKKAKKEKKHPGETELTGFSWTANSCFVDSTLYALLINQNAIIDKFILKKEFKTEIQQKYRGSLQRIAEKIRSSSNEHIYNQDLYDIILERHAKTSIRKGSCGEPQEILSDIFQTLNVDIITKCVITTCFVKIGSNEFNTTVRYEPGPPFFLIDAGLFKKWETNPNCMHSIEEVLDPSVDLQYHEDVDEESKCHFEVIQSIPKLFLEEDYIIFVVSRKRTQHDELNNLKLLIPEKLNIEKIKKISAPAVTKIQLECTAIVAGARHYVCYFKYKNEWYVSDGLKKGANEYIGSFQHMLVHDKMYNPTTHTSLVFYT
jgi:hypothetical protein